MKTRTYLLTAFVLLAFINSCTIEKRQYMPGYHVDFLKSNKQKVAAIPEKEVVKEEQLAGEQKMEEQFTASASGDLTEEDIKKNDVKVYDDEKKSVSPQRQQIEERPAKAILKKSWKKPVSDGGDLHWAAIVSLVTALLGACILAIVFGIIALYEIKRNPDKYRGKGMAIAGIIIGAFVFILVMVVIIAALMYV